MTGSRMAEETKTDRVTLKELMVSTLAMTDALAKLMIAKGILTERLLAAQLPIESANTETETVNQIPTAITGTDC